MGQGYHEAFCRGNRDVRELLRYELDMPLL
jgi:hypothetical protein